MSLLIFVLYSVRTCKTKYLVCNCNYYTKTLMCVERKGKCNAELASKACTSQPTQCETEAAASRSAQNLLQREAGEDEG